MPRFTEQQIEQLKNLYPNTRTDKIAAIINKSVKSIYSKANYLGLKKTDEFLCSEESGRLFKGHKRGEQTRFKVGQISHNKGRKRSEYTSPEGIERSRATQFKKGNLPKQTRHDGALSVRRFKNRYYLFIRIALGKWITYHRYLWEQENGPMPKGHKVIFEDGNTANLKIENLKLVSEAEHMLRNSFINLPDELKELIHLKTRINTQIRKANEQQENKS